MEYILPVGFVAFMLCVLVWLLRTGVVSRFKTQGAGARLRHPDPESVTPLAGFRPPPELVAFFEGAPYLERQEFQLVDRRADGERSWIIGEFVPLTATDVREAQFISGAKETIPIAWDMDKGVYLVISTGAVVLRSPDVPGGEVPVAENATRLLSFEAEEIA